MPREVEKLYLILNYLSNHPYATAEQVDIYIRYFLARLKDPVEAAIQEGAESEERAVRLFRNFEEVYHIEKGTSHDDHVDVDLWVFCHILKYSEELGYEVVDMPISVQVKSSSSGVDEAIRHMEEHRDYRFVIDAGFEREDYEILDEIEERFPRELGISLTRRNDRVNE